MSLVDFAENELLLIEKQCGDDEEARKMQHLVTKDVLDIVKIFSKQGHSGFSANYTINLIQKVLKYIPLTPLTGEDDEWVQLDYTDDVHYQNKRCPSIFKDKDGRAYNIEGKVFSNDNGHTWYTNRDSRVYIEFPYRVPEKAEAVIIDNKEERNSILKDIVEIIKDKFEIINLDTEITEDTYLQSIFDITKCEQLAELIKEKFNLVKLYDRIGTEDKMWHIISNIQHSDKV